MNHPIIFPLNFLSKLKKFGYHNFGKYDPYTLTAEKDNEIWYFQFEPARYELKLTEITEDFKVRKVTHKEFISQLCVLAQCNDNFRYVQVSTKEWRIIDVDALFD
jgi:hypothetical protein